MKFTKVWVIANTGVGMSDEQIQFSLEVVINLQPAFIGAVFDVLTWPDENRRHSTDWSGTLNLYAASNVGYETKFLTCTAVGWNMAWCAYDAVTSSAVKLYMDISGGFFYTPAGHDITSYFQRLQNAIEYCVRQVHLTLDRIIWPWFDTRSPQRFSSWVVQHFLWPHRLVCFLFLLRFTSSRMQVVHDAKKVRDFKRVFMSAFWRYLLNTVTFLQNLGSPKTRFSSGDYKQKPQLSWIWYKIEKPLL